jgi:putative peptide zinc metalloprotease protein
MSTAFPRKSPTIAIDPSNGTHRIIHRAQSRSYFRLGEREADYLDALDGSRSREALLADRDGGFREDQVAYLLQWYEEQGLLEGFEPVEVDEPKRSWLRRVTDIIVRPDLWRITLVNPDAFLDRNRRAVDALFSPVAMSVYLFLLLLPIVVAVISPSLAIDAFEQRVEPKGLWIWLTLYAMVLGMNVLHELAHALACKHFGGKVEKIGLMFMYLQPVMYCDVTDSWRFNQASQKIAVAGAGMFLQFVLAGISMTGWLFTANSILLCFTFINIFIALFNLFPLIKLDGYWMLVHWLDEPNLRHRGMEALDTVFRRIVARPLPDSRPVRPAFLAFGVGHGIAVPMFWLLGLYGIHRLLSKVSEPLALFVVAVFGLPLAYRAVKAAIGYARTFSPVPVPRQREAS